MWGGEVSEACLSSCLSFLLLLFKVGSALATFPLTIKHYDERMDVGNKRFARLGGV